jgi:O-antigen ligase
MSIRVILCFLFVIGFSIYAWRNWFVSLCAAIVMMAVLEHPDMPKNMGGFQGLNPWNMLMLNVLLAWFFHRRRDGLIWDMPSYVAFLGLAYVSVIIVSFLRLLADDKSLGSYEIFENYSFGFSVSEYLINCVKWVLPGVLLYDGCRSRRRILIALAVFLSVYFLLALQVIKHMPMSAATASAGELSRMANKILIKEVGYHRVNLSMMFSGASWAVLTTLMLVEKWKHKILLLSAAALISLAQALTGGRAGYVTWGVVGLILCLVRWRRLLPVIPVTVAVVCIFLPAVRERMLQGFGGKSGAVIVETSDYEITSGRNLAWGYVIPKIKESPLFGYGRQAMVRTGIYQRLLDEYGEGETFPHPHNAFLELLLDNGVIGFISVIPFYLVVLWHSLRVLLDRSDPLFAAVGGTCCALVLALFVAGMGSQTFYPREGSVGMWAAIGLLLRLSVERSYSRTFDTPLFDESEEGVGDDVIVAQPV